MALVLHAHPFSSYCQKVEIALYENDTPFTLKMLGDADSFAELARLGEALGAKRETLMGLSGLGDLMLSATSRSSRNFSAGVELGGGKQAASLSAPGHALAEGVATAPALVARAKQAGIELPIAEAVADLLAGKLPLEQAVARLMNRKLTSE